MEPEATSQEVESLTALFLSATRRIVTLVEKHPVTATLVGPIVFSVIHGIGFLVISTHFGARGVPIEKIGFGARTFEVGTMPILILVAIGVFLGCCFVIANELPPMAQNLFQSIRDRYTFSLKSRGTKRLREFFVELGSGKAWRRFVGKYLRPIALIPLSAYMLFNFSTQAPALFQLLFPGLAVNIPTATFNLRILAVVATFFFWLWLPTRRTNQPAPPLKKNIPESVDRDFKVVKVAFWLYGLFLMAMGFLLLCLIFAVGLYPNMLRELGGGMPRAVTMHFKNELCTELDFTCPKSGSLPDTSAVKVLLVFEDENEYRVSKIDNENPPIIYAVSKQDVTLVAISPPEQTP